jgi:tetratricopeptide (TPR) repeat protein/glycosyltransferase involved in cell wall biosynthesis
MLDLPKTNLSARYQSTETSQQEQSGEIKLSSTIESRSAIEQGDIFWSQNHLSAAIDCYRQAIKLDPSSAKAHHKMAIVLKQQGNLEEASSYYRQAIALINNDSERRDRNQQSLSITTQINNHISLKQLDTSADLYTSNKSMPQSPQHHLDATLETAQLYLQQALAYCEDKQWQQAIDSCEDALQIVPTLAEAYKIRGNSLHKLGKIPEAIGAYAKALTIEPDLVDIYVNVGSLYASQQKWEQALNYYQKAIAINPNLSIVYRNLAKIWEKLGDKQQSQHCLTRSLYLEKNSQPTLAQGKEQPQLSPSQQQPSLPSSEATPAQLQVRQGDLYVQKQQWQEAIACYQQAIKLEPKSAQAYRDLAKAYNHLGQSEAAIECLYQALTLEPDEAEAEQHFGLAKLLRQQGKIDGAIVCYRQAIGIKPELSEAYLHLGEIWQDRGEIDKAIACYQQLIKLKPSDSQGYHNLGDAFSAGEQWEAASSSYLSAIKLNPNFAWSYNNLGNALLKRQQWEEAAQCFQQAIKLNSNFAWSHYNLGEAFVKLQMWEEAESAYKHSQQLQADLPNLEAKINAVLQSKQKAKHQKALGFYLQAIEKDPNDLDSYQKAIAMQPDDPELCLRLADALVAKNKFTEAIALYQRIIVLKPQSLAIYQKLGELWRRQKQWQEAQALYQQAVKQYPDNFEFHFYLGEVCTHQKKWKQAKTIYQKAIALNPNHWQAYHNYGDTLLNLSDWQGAIVSYRKVLALKPDYAWSHHNLGTALFYAEVWAEAIIAFERAIQLDRGFSKYYEKLGEALLKLEKWEEAIALYRQALESEPNSTYATERLSYALHRRMQSNVTEAVDFYQSLAPKLPKPTQKPNFFQICQELEQIVNFDLAPMVVRGSRNARDRYLEAEAALKTGNFAKAILCWREAVQLNPKADREWWYDAIGKTPVRPRQISIDPQAQLQPIEPNLTIVVPIYNAYEDLQRCLAALIEHTDPKYQVLLIDDGSTDSRIAELLQEIAAKHDQISSIANPQNLGFVKTCNFAFKIAKKDDIVILNSDTVVTKGWLEKLFIAAYAHPSIGSVTPLTNNGEICSVPNWLKFNDIPDSHSIDSFAEVIERISLRQYPTIPTCVGFCTYMKREVLDRVGYFDEISFGKGYGEENDWSRRVIQAGYHHIIDDSTFVYHAGGKSFGVDEKQQLVLDNFKPLEEKHPDYFQEVHKYIELKPAQAILTNIQLHLRLEEIRASKPVCFILHNTTDLAINFPLGGTEYHCGALIEEIRETQPVYTLCFNRHNSSLLLNIFLAQEVLRFQFPCFLPETNNYQYSNPQFLKVFVEVLEYFQPGLIHIHHLINLPIKDIMAGLEQLDIPYCLTLHDYYLICPSFNLLDRHNQFCYERKSQDYCRQCIQALFGQGKNLKEDWYDYCQELMLNAATIFTPSETAKSYFIQEYPQLTDKIQVIRHGIAKKADLNKIDKNNSRRFSSLPLRIAFVGGISNHKGLDLIIELLATIQTNPQMQSKFSFELFGELSEPLPASIQNLQLHGRYEPLELPHLLKEVDLVMFAGIWAETYCLVADEVLAAGIPIITTPIGAVAERVTKFGVGWIAQSSTVKGLLDVLVSLVYSPQAIELVKKNVLEYVPVSFETMAEQYLDEYSKQRRNLAEQLPVIESGLSSFIEIDSQKNPSEKFQNPSLLFAYLQAKWFIDNRL